MNTVTDKLALASIIGAAPKIGTYWPGQGGIYGGVQRGENGLPDYHLIVPTDSSAHIQNIVWSESYADQPGAKSKFDGRANTLALVAAAESHPAAQWAAGLVVDDHRDFYLPAINELGLLRATVPELFQPGWHWSSTQGASSSDYAWLQHFGYGGQYYNHKGFEYRARAVRRTLIIE